MKVPMLKQRLSEAAHGALRDRAHRSVAAMDASQVRDRIHHTSPVPGRIFTLVAGEDVQRKLIHSNLDSMSHTELREAAGDRLPPLLKRLLEWLDR
jgi:hypothetical protein